MAIKNVLKIPVLLCGFLISCTSQEQKIKDHYSEIEFFGIIKSKLLDPEQKMQPVVILENAQKYRISNFEVFQVLEVGDTVFKKSGSMKYYYIKNGDTSIFYFKHGGYEIRD